MILFDSLSYIFANKLWGEFLDIDFQSIYKFNKWVISEKSIFLFSWIEDGAIIKRMPLINILAMCGSKLPQA